MAALILSQRWNRLIVVMALLPLAGCGNDGRPQPVRVSGTVTYKGQPVPGAQVVFLSKGDSPAAVGHTDDDGSFRLSTYEEEDGALPGDYNVTVVKMQSAAAGSDPNAPFDPVADMEAAARNTGPPPPAKSLLPPKYGAAATSGLQFTVASSGTNQFKIELVE